VRGACPAYAAGQPLNPKKLIQDMVAAQSHGTDPPMPATRIRAVKLRWW
jgi:hypothetical protein